MGNYVFTLRNHKKRFIIATNEMFVSEMIQQKIHWRQQRSNHLHILLFYSSVIDIGFHKHHSFVYGGNIPL